MSLRRAAHTAGYISWHCPSGVKGHSVTGNDLQDMMNFEHSKVLPLVVSFHSGQAKHSIYKPVRMLWVTDFSVLFLRVALTNSK